MYTSLLELESGIKSVFDGNSIIDESLLRGKVIDELVFTAVFTEDEELRKSARANIRKLARIHGATPSSINNYYMAIGKGEVVTSATVPAINIRFMTYDTARIIFSLLIKHNAGPILFEIARSEMGYTFQRPDEYSVSVLAAAIKENYKGPVFIQGDHFQFKPKDYKENPEKEINNIKELITESINAEFLNIDIDASTLVDHALPTLDEQQGVNYKLTAELTKHIRSIEPAGTTVSIGAEIGHIGGVNSTPQDLEAFMEGYKKLIGDVPGISKISVQTGTSHGGIPLPDGTMKEVSLDFGVIAATGEVARSKYQIGGVVQHGASTLPNELFNNFPKNRTLEIHLATGFQNIVYDAMPAHIKEEIYKWLDENHGAEWDDKNNRDQNIYKTRKRAIGPFKKQMWELSDEAKKPIRDALTQQLEFLFEQLNLPGTRDELIKHV